MATYLVYRPTLNDRYTLPTIGGIILNAADGPSAITAAVVIATRLCGALDGPIVSNWTATQLSASDATDTTASGLVIQGPVKLPGELLRGASSKVPLNTSDPVTPLNPYPPNNGSN